jgi:hypothetical protein
VRRGRWPSTTPVPPPRRRGSARPASATSCRRGRPRRRRRPAPARRGSAPTTTPAAPPTPLPAPSPAGERQNQQRTATPAASSATHDGQNQGSPALGHGAAALRAARAARVATSTLTWSNATGARASPVRRPELVRRGTPAGWWPGGWSAWPFDDRNRERCAGASFGDSAFSGVAVSSGVSVSSGCRSDPWAGNRSRLRRRPVAGRRKRRRTSMLRLHACRSSEPTHDRRPESTGASRCGARMGP